MTNPYTIDTAILCHHCGDVCSDNSIFINDFIFCCNGCKTVYEILNEKDLCAYYDLDANPGLKIKARTDDTYAYLDKEEIVSSLIDFRNDGVASVHFYVPSIHCSSCLWLLEKLYKIEPGIQRSDVSFTKKEVSITYQESVISLRRIVELLNSLGYTPQIQLDKTKDKNNKIVDRSIFYKLAVAGFCSSNIMLMSFPEYFGLHRMDEYTYATVFGYISIALGLPVLIYSASDFYVSAWKGVKNKMINLDVPIVIGMTSLFSRSVYDILTHTGAGYIDSFSGLVFFLLIGKWYQSKIYQAMSFERDYQSYFPVAVTKVLNNVEEPVQLSDLKVGDEMYIRSQEIIPADSILLSSVAYIDYSFVSGESAPVMKKMGDLIYAGGRQTNGRILLRVKKEVSQSHLLQLWNNKLFDKDLSLTGVSAIANSFGRNFTYGLLFVSVVTFIYWYTISVESAFNALTAVLIVACPCALALSIPFAYGNALRILAKQGLFLRGADVVEKLASIDTVVFDKTGTITKSNGAAVTFEGNILSDSVKSVVRALVEQSTHPLSVQLSRFLASFNSNVVFQYFEEIPSQGLLAIVDGVEYRLGSAVFTSAPQVNDILFSRVYLSVNNICVGSYVLRNEYRLNIDNMILDLKQEKQLYLLSGDTDSERLYLNTIFPDSEKILFNQSPIDKLNVIATIQQGGFKALMLGDGLNDAGALKQSNVGISVSEDVYNFSPSCDGIIDASKITSLNRMLEFCSGTVQSVKATLIFSLLYNVVVISLAVQGLFTPMVAAIIMPISSVFVVLMVVVTTNILARRHFK
jgi:P-type Cu+ transporter